MGSLTTAFPADGPDYLDITNPIGTFELAIPPAGMVVDIMVEGVIGVDFDRDGVVDASIVIDPVSVGTHASSGRRRRGGRAKCRFRR